jgi:hypothetical protein
VTNKIGGDLVCHRNDPAPQVGDSGGSPNVVGGRKVDQCEGLWAPACDCDADLQK